MKTWEDVVDGFKEIIDADPAWSMWHENEFAICAESPRHTVNLFCTSSIVSANYLLRMYSTDRGFAIDNVDDVNEVAASVEMLKRIFEFVAPLQDKEIKCNEIPNDIEKLVLHRMQHGAEIVALHFEKGGGFVLKELDRLKYPLTDITVHRLHSANLIKEEFYKADNYTIAKKFVLA